jgi:hypothetical protein
MSEPERIKQVWPKAKDEQTKQKVQFYHDLDAKWRGRFLIQTNWMESDVDTVISYLFFGKDTEKSNLFRSTILKRMTLDTKIQTLHQILQIKFPDLATEHEKLNGKLDSIKKFRNKLAHADLTITRKFIEKDPKDRIPIKIFEDGKEKSQEILVKDIEDKLVLTTEIHTSINEIFKAIQVFDSKNKS